MISTSCPKARSETFRPHRRFIPVKVQRLGNDRIKPFAQVGRNLVVPVLALVGDMPIQPRKCSDTTPPIVRTFDLSADSFVECAKFFQGVFQKLGRLFLFAVAKGQVKSPLPKSIPTLSPIAEYGSVVEVSVIT